MTNPSSDPRRIKSFVLRQGRVSPGQKKALEAYWPRYGCALEQGRLDWTQVFGRQADTFLEIGFGMGHSLAEMALARPEHNFIGVEVHKPGVGALLKSLGAAQLTNVRVFNEDAVAVLEQNIPPRSLAGIYIFFPDPWHKKRHHKRRLIQPHFLTQLAHYIQPNGLLHMATDWEDYAQQMMQVATDSPYFDNTQAPGGYSPRPSTRPRTKFEQRGQKLGHDVWDLVFTRNTEALD